ncbi:Hypothetical predicted protein [Olea europaea subsp. europaea]|uniref:Uncharacterized protein n=1 Tax=Olea europaea subsp. europaea TaxID=158383 RepID=A0A8S0RIZ1_OLEEU|nr:Hypothetical predicted protein [Olea europaea subsp. europaea]
MIVHRILEMFRLSHKARGLPYACLIPGFGVSFLNEVHKRVPLPIGQLSIAQTDIASLQMNAAVVETNVQWMRWHWEDGFDSEEATNSD